MNVAIKRTQEGSYVMTTVTGIIKASAETINVGSKIEQTILRIDFL